MRVSETISVRKLLLVEIPILGKITQHGYGQAQVLKGLHRYTEVYIRMDYSIQKR